MKHVKKLLALVLVLCMAFSLVPAGVFAAEITSESETPTPVAETVSGENEMTETISGQDETEETVSKTKKRKGIRLRWKRSLRHRMFL